MPTYSPFDTIAAVSTPFGKGGVAVIRISGTEALEVAARVFLPRSGRALAACEPRRVILGDMIAPEGAPFAGRAGEVLDDGLCTVFRAPHSYTGEDTVELSCHGGVLVTQSVLTAVLCAGARQALAGEFTRRAYMNGRLDLEHAEALGNLLDAGNEAQLRLSRAGMSGLLTKQAEELYASLCGVLANVEAGIDFPEEDLTEMPREEVAAAVCDALASVTRLSATYRTGHAIAEGIPTVIVGRPNVGKSAFYNRLVGRDAAIVTEIAGTTRDVLSETVSVGRVTLRLSDTAGLRASDDPVERIGVERARTALSDAELVFALFDPHTPYTGEDEALAAELASLEAGGRAVVWILSKSDVPGGGSSLPAGADPKQDAPRSLPHPSPLALSAVTGEGFDELTRRVEQIFVDGSLRMGEEAVVFSARQAASLNEAAAALTRAAALLDAGVTYDVIAEDVRDALAALGTLCGREIREDVLTEIFSRFCVGK